MLSTDGIVTLQHLTSEITLATVWAGLAFHFTSRLCLLSDSAGPWRCTEAKTDRLTDNSEPSSNMHPSTEGSDRLPGLWDRCEFVACTTRGPGA